MCPGRHILLGPFCPETVFFKLSVVRKTSQRTKGDKYLVRTGELFFSQVTNPNGQFPGRDRTTERIKDNAKTNKKTG